MIVSAHIFGIPVEENLPYLLSAGGVTFALKLRAAQARARVDDWRASLPRLLPARCRYAKRESALNRG